MNKKLKKCTVLTLSAFACAGIAAGILTQTGVLAKKVSAQENTLTSIAKLDTKLITGDNNVYANLGTVNDASGNTWAFRGNMTTNPWRMGGKASSTAEALETEREFYKQGVFTKDIKKIEIKSGSSSDVTVNSLKLYVCKPDKDGKPGDVVYTNTISPYPSETGTYTFEPETEQDWSGKIFKIAFDIKITATKNKFFSFDSIEYFADVQLENPDAVAISGGKDSVALAESTTFIATCTKEGETEGVDQNVVWSISTDGLESNVGGAVITEAGVFTGLKKGQVYVQAKAKNVDVSDKKLITIGSEDPDATDFETYLTASNLNLTNSYSLVTKYYSIKGLTFAGKNVIKSYGNITFGGTSRGENFLYNVSPFISSLKAIRINPSSYAYNATAYGGVLDAEGEISWTELTPVSVDGETVYDVSENDYKYLKFANTNTATPTNPSSFASFTLEFKHASGSDGEAADNVIAAIKNVVDTYCPTASITTDIWNKLAADVKAITDAKPAALTYLSGAELGDKLTTTQKVLETYDYIMSKYNAEEIVFANFLNRDIQSSGGTATPVKEFNATATAIIAVTAVALLSALTFVIVSKKKKSAK